MQAEELLGSEILVFSVLHIYRILAGELESMRYTRLEDVLFWELIIAHCRSLLPLFCWPYVAYA